jgi:hypothetical protein
MDCDIFKETNKQTNKQTNEMFVRKANRRSGELLLDSGLASWLFTPNVLGDPRPSWFAGESFRQINI